MLWEPFQHERTITFFSHQMAKSPMPTGIGNFSNIPGTSLPGKGVGTTTPLDLEQLSRHSEKPTSPYHSSGIKEMDKPIIIETAVVAMDELMELLRMTDPVWVTSPTDGRYMLHRDSYDKLFPKPNHFKSATARMESSKDSGEVAMAAMHLVDMLLDSV